MRPLFHPALINGPDGDPAVYVDCLFERRALLFDLGDLAALPSRKLLRVSDIFVSHTHVDHFIGFDRLLRVALGRARRVRMFGPPGFLDQVEHKLGAYTWNLVQNYETDLAFEVCELDPDGAARRATFRCRSGFRREPQPPEPIEDGVLVAEEDYLVRATFLDHRIPVLAFALEEHEHLNVWKNRLSELGLPVGPWLRELKRAVRRRLPPGTAFSVAWRDASGSHEHRYALGELVEKVLRIVPGQKIVYVTDAIYHSDNARRIVALARNADYLFIESPFLERDAQRAARKYHLTARQAGRLAREAGVRVVVPFHFSPIYDESGPLRAEVDDAFAGAPTADRQGL